MDDRVEIDDDVIIDHEQGSKNGHKNTIYKSDAQNAFHHSEGLNFLRALIEVGSLDDDTTLPNLAIRATIPSKFTEGHVLATAIADCWSQNVRYHNEEGNKQLIMMVAGWTGVDSERAKLMVRAAAGEIENPNRSHNWGERIQQMAWGNKARG